MSESEVVELVRVAADGLQVALARAFEFGIMVEVSTETAPPVTPPTLRVEIWKSL